MYFKLIGPEKEIETADGTCTISQIPIPERIARDKQMMQLWTFILADFEKRRVLSPSYAILISELVEVTCLMHKCRQEIDKAARESDDGNGELIMIYDTDRDGNKYLVGVSPSPWLKILNTQQTIQLKLMEKLGMTPRDIVFIIAPEGSIPVAGERFEDDRPEGMRGITYFRS
jgi:hypothetical protein